MAENSAIEFSLISPSLSRAKYGSLAAGLDWWSRGRPATPKQPVTRKQQIGWSLVALALALVLILVRYASLYWLEVLTVPIMGLVALGLTWGLSE